MISITYLADRDVYLSRHDFSDNPIVKGAGFWFDPDGSKCGIAKRWWTAKREIAAKLAEYADNSCRETLMATHARQQATHAASRATSAPIDLVLPCPDGIAYLPFQRAGIQFACQRPATLIGDEMGLGKTVQAIGTLNVLLAERAPRHVLIVCPKTLKLNWARELDKWLTWPLTIGQADTKVWPDTDIVIIHYDALHVHTSVMRACVWDMLIVDEAHLLKNPKTRRTRSLLGRRSKKVEDRIAPVTATRRLMLTGTPIVNRPVELWPIISSLDPETWSNFFAYGKRYCAGHQDGYGWDFTGASNLGELQDRLRSTIMIRRLKEDVLKELPAKRRQVIDLARNGAAKVVDAESAALARHAATRDALEAALELATADTNKEAYAKAVAALRLGAKIMLEEMSSHRHAVAVAKLPQVIEYLQGVLEDDESAKVVCFAHHLDVLHGIADAFGASAVMIAGDTSMDDRQAAVDRFQSDPTCRLFVGSILAAGVGITLTASAHVVFAELDWVPGNVTQAEDRTHRIGQTQSVLVQHLVVDGSLDAKMARTLIAKQRVIDKALDDPSVPILPSMTATIERTRRTELESVAEKLTPAQIKAIHAGLRHLKGVCDGAVSLDRMGFSGCDVRVGHSLASATSLTPRQAALGQKLIRKYRRQLGEDLVTAACGPAEPDPSAEVF